MPDWGDVFLPTAPVAETLVRGTVMFLAIFVLMRLTGQRESGVHSLTDLLVVVLVAQAAANGMSGDGRGIVDSVLLVATILGWSLALDVVAYRWPRVAPLLKPRAIPLVVDGRIDRRALRREFMQREELMAELRLHGITDVREVRRAYLEANGMVSVIRADGAQPDEPSAPRAVG